MNEHDFIMWLHGFCELSTEPPTKEQWQTIKEHLSTIFNKATPPHERIINHQKLKEELDKQKPIPPSIFPPYDRTIWGPPPLQYPIVTC